MKVEFVFYD